MDVFQKFIIETDVLEGDCLILAKCTFHKQLVTDATKVKGGGWWTLEDSVVTFYGNSHDFGEAKLSDIEKCIKEKKIFSSSSLHRNITDRFKYKYKKTNGEIMDF